MARMGRPESAAPQAAGAELAHSSGRAAGKQVRGISSPENEMKGGRRSNETDAEISLLGDPRTARTVAVKTLAFASIFSLASLNAHGDNPSLMRATEASFVFEDGTRVKLKTDGSDCLDAVEVIVEGKNLKIPKADLGDIHAPYIHSVRFTHPLPDRWELTVSYAFGEAGLPRTSSEITICFGKGGFIEKTRKIPTGKDTWIYKRQKAGKPEEDEGQGGSLPMRNILREAEPIDP
jgi:hypothetical protein